MVVVKPAGAIGIPGVYTNLDPGAPYELAKQGKLAWSFPKAWVKSPSLTAGQCPVMRYNRDPMMAILWDRMPYLTNLLNTEITPVGKGARGLQGVPRRVAQPGAAPRKRSGAA